MSTVALTPTLGELTPKYESSSGNKLVFVYSTIADLKKRIDAGETADVMILSRPAIDELQTKGKVAEGSVVNVGSSYVAIGVRAGAPRPDISTAEKLKAVLLAVKSISYADPAKGGASGIYFAKVLDRLGIADQMKSKTVLVPGAQAGELVAKGEVEMGVAQASEIASVPGAQVLQTAQRSYRCARRGSPQPSCTTAMKRHNHSSGDRPIQYGGKYSRHSRGQTKAKNMRLSVTTLSGAAGTAPNLDLQ
jgi:molybdate transport system substrate-binding protein